VVLTAANALAAAEGAARAAGCEVLNLGADVEGEARTVAAGHARLALRLGAERRDPRPLVILSGGETAVRVSGKGLGGRNTEYLLALAIALDEAAAHALAADTDGIDGRGGHAGAVLSPDSLRRWAALGLDPAASLRSNDSRDVFARAGDLIETGPTRTNVNDFRAILLPGR
jgi:hydroxypyruvate reductase